MCFCLLHMYCDETKKYNVLVYFVSLYLITHVCGPRFQLSNLYAYLSYAKLNVQGRQHYSFLFKTGFSFLLETFSQIWPSPKQLQNNSLIHLLNKYHWQKSHYCGNIAASFNTDFVFILLHSKISSM